MVDITQVIQALQVEKSRAMKELARLDDAIRALQKVKVPKAGAAAARASKPRRKRRKMSAAARRRIAAAQRARWAKVRKQKAAPK